MADFSHGERRLERQGPRLVWLFMEVSQDTDGFRLPGLHPLWGAFILMVTRGLLHCVQISAGRRWEGSGQSTVSFSFNKGRLYLALPCIFHRLHSTGGKETGRPQRPTGFLTLLVTTLFDTLCPGLTSA